MGGLNWNKKILKTNKKIITCLIFDEKSAQSLGTGKLALLFGVIKGVMANDKQVISVPIVRKKWKLKRNKLISRLFLFFSKMHDFYIKNWFFCFIRFYTFYNEFLMFSKYIIWRHSLVSERCRVKIAS